jgi:hypothetical protein
MDSDDNRWWLPDFDPARATALMPVAVAEGILVERYQISAELASALLRSRAYIAGLSALETAAWLHRTGALP